MEHSPDPEPIPAADLAALIARAVREWDAGTPLPALDVIRTRGTYAQYAEAVNALCDHDEAMRLLTPPPLVHRPPNRAD